MKVNVRIDERLIHGQIATMWTNHLNLDRIIVVDDEVSKSEMEIEVLKMARPSSVKLSVLSVGGLVRRLNDNRYQGETALLIVKSPITLVKIMEEGIGLPEIIVGNMSTKENSIKVTRSVSVTPEDVESFNTLNSSGIRLIFQMVPSDNKEDFMKLLKEEI